MVPFFIKKKYMRLKSELFSNERNDVVKKLVELLGLETNTVLVLYELDKNIELQNMIMELVPDIRKYYNCNNIKAVTEPSRIKRPWLSIVKTILKPVYQIQSQDYHFTHERKYIHTQKYTFTKKCCDISNNSLEKCVD